MAETPHRHSADGHATDKLGHGLTKKLGPLPVWGWGLLLGVAAYFIYARMSANAASSSGSTATTAASSTTTGDLDPDAIDPNTGLTYGEEEDAAENAEAADDSGGLGSGGTTESGLTTPETPSQEISDVLGYIQGLQQIEAALTPTSSPSAAANAASNPTNGGGPVQGSGGASTSGPSPTIGSSTTSTSTSTLTPAQQSAAAVKGADQILAHPTKSGDGVPGGTLAGLAALNKVTTPPIPKVDTTKKKK